MVLSPQQAGGEAVAVRLFCENPLTAKAPISVAERSAALTQDEQGIPFLHEPHKPFSVVISNTIALNLSSSCVPERLPTR